MNKITVTFIIIFVAVGIIADVIFAAVGGGRATISAQIWILCHEWPVISFAFGFLSGHLMWQAKRVYATQKDQ